MSQRHCCYACEPSHMFWGEEQQFFTNPISDWESMRGTLLLFSPADSSAVCGALLSSHYGSLSVAGPPLSKAELISCEAGHQISTPFSRHIHTCAHTHAHTHTQPGERIHWAELGKPRQRNVTPVSVHSCYVLSFQHAHASSNSKGKWLKYIEQLFVFHTPSKGCYQEYYRLCKKKVL